jgi:hypothetical protein
VNRLFTRLQVALGNMQLQKEIRPGGKRHYGIENALMGQSTLSARLGFEIEFELLFGRIAMVVFGML